MIHMVEKLEIQIDKPRSKIINLLYFTFPINLQIADSATQSTYEMKTLIWLSFFCFKMFQYF